MLLKNGPVKASKSLKRFQWVELRLKIHSEFYEVKFWNQTKPDMFLANVQCTVQGEKEKKIITFEPKVAQRAVLPFQREKPYIFSKYQTSEFKSQNSTFFEIQPQITQKAQLRIWKKCHGTIPFFPRLLKIALVFLCHFFWVTLEL